MSKLFFSPNINKDLINYYIIIYIIKKKLPIGNWIYFVFKKIIVNTTKLQIKKPLRIIKTTWTIFLFFFIINKQII